MPARLACNTIELASRGVPLIDVPAVLETVTTLTARIALFPTTSRSVAADGPPLGIGA